MVDKLELGTFFKQKKKEPRADIAQAVLRIERDESVSGTDEHGDEFRRGFARSATGFDFWSSQPRVKPRDAALLVCGYNPKRVEKLALEDFEYLPIDTPSKRTVQDLPPAEVQSILSNFEDFKKKAGRPLSEREEHLIRMELLDMHLSNPGPLTAADVQSLLSKLEEVAASNPKPLSSDDVEVTLEVFEAEQCRDPKLRKLADWFAVAQDAGLRVSGTMLQYAEAAALAEAAKLMEQAQSAAELSPAGSAEPGPVVATSKAPPKDEWKDAARSVAQEIIKRQAKRDLFPSQNDLADEVATALREKKIYGTDGKPLSGATIKRHALKGISSAVKKAKSTAIKRSK